MHYVNALPDIETILLRMQYTNCHKAKPAVKSNVGTFVETEFQLPIRILAQQSTNAGGADHFRGRPRNHNHGVWIDRHYSKIHAVDSNA